MAVSQFECNGRLSFRFINHFARVIEQRIGEEAGVDQELEAREQRAQPAWLRIYAFVGNSLKDVLMGLGLIFVAILIFGAL
jgi:hypothetical protein